MMQYPHSHVAHCNRCQDPFHYDASVCVVAPRVCDQCKLSRRALTEVARKEKSQQAQRERGERRKQHAIALGYSSDAMGDSLKKLTVRSHAEVGAILGISAESSRQLERSALAKCHKAFASYLLEQNLDNSLRTHE